MSSDTDERQLVDVPNIDHWQIDSLYVYDADINEFYEEYSNIFDCGIYNNLQSGAFDTCGINYYRAELTEPVILKLQKLKPADGDTLAAWLVKAKEHNGFYILGM